VDSILNFHRQKHGIPKSIGLFTSPHLLAVRERIRINSAPISEELFAKYFFEVWDALESSAAAAEEDPKYKPVYFRYLTLMSYHVFLREGIDAAIYEVGVGGAFDGTNLVEKPAVTGITALGIDHTFMLGETIEEISWHKAGIMKKGSPAFTVEQVPAAAAVVRDQAAEKGVELEVVKKDNRLAGVKILPDAEFQKLNASMGVKLASTVLKKLDPKFELPQDALPQDFVDGLEQVVWRGRCEIKVDGNIRWYLDGAHTRDSLKVAAQWYDSQCAGR
jgi:folylpolyglutamate synthase